jgi:hypothetical protein
MNTWKNTPIEQPAAISDLGAQEREPYEDQIDEASFQWAEEDQEEENLNTWPVSWPIKNLQQTGPLLIEFSLVPVADFSEEDELDLADEWNDEPAMAEVVVIAGQYEIHYLFGQNHWEGEGETVPLMKNESTFRGIPVKKAASEGDESRQIKVSVKGK